MLPITLTTANGKITFITSDYHRIDGDYLVFYDADQANPLLQQFEYHPLAANRLTQLYSHLYDCVPGTPVSWSQVQKGLSKNILAHRLHAVKLSDESLTASPPRSSVLDHQQAQQHAQERDLPGILGVVQAMNRRNRDYQRRWNQPPGKSLSRPQPKLRYQYFLNLSYHFDDGSPLTGLPYRATFSDGKTLSGKLNDLGNANLLDIPQGITTVEFGWPNLNPQLDQARRELETYLNDIITEVQQHAAQQEQALADAGVLERGHVYTLAFLDGLYDSVADLADLAVDIGGTIDDARQHAFQQLLHGSPLPLKTALEDLARYGEDTLHDLEQAQQNLARLFEDPQLKILLTRFPGRYWDALSGQSKAQMVGGLSFSLVIALLTAGAGAAASIASKAPSIMKAADKIQEILQLLEKTRLHKIAKKDQNSYINLKTGRPNQPPLNKKPPKKCRTCKKAYNPKCPLADPKRQGKGENDRNDNTLKKGIRETSGKVYPAQHRWYQGPASLDVHHCIDVDSVKNAVWLEIFNAFRYDINEPHNSVVLPATMDAACHLAVARHKGSHAQGHGFDSPKPGTGASLSGLQALENAGDFGEIPVYEQKFLTYPDAVKEEIRKLRLSVKKGGLCGHKTAKQQKQAFEQEMRDISESILKRIDDFTWTLSRDGRDYRPDSACGCANQLKLGKKIRGEACNTNRQHGYDMKKTTNLKLGH